ncbi:ABC transporter ATP-binding protein [Corynebacterium propinquum]|uniref:ABC transporter ATP-binding protein n=1 Tax=Corynebacterium propinquum TaxID=43769 RepID=A0AAP4BUA8_9CORY|nr:ABC transporter ATP-binding protein [Corynebacterium propinquum]MCG7230876.1 ABC transporter ATP-binding protein [Corynebacterium propinquum]MDK4302499.1 ABC transporter ATP-binding protein [Corynebacterium propinquum]MDK4318583.1 ABC transporter ATP-binding protein [Corynebacterium propinquum]MDK4325459.1 ABC transporter ATP-binding protein [Corynebacterium propinquum]MDK8664990.1 ABC transporter ATP-binding protein [Corynebacterium propinquum]
MELTTAQPAATEPVPQEVSLEISGLSASYGAHSVLHDVNVARLTGGQIVGLLGPNASGKTTLIKTLADVHRGYTGHVDFQVDGVTPRGKKKRQLTGYVPQDLPSTAALRAFEAVLIAARRETCEDPVLRTGEVMHELGLDGIASRYLNELSGGQRQLIALAQMLVGRPGLMLLDEPTSALDLHHQLFVLSQVRAKSRQEGSLGLIAIHDINLAARMCDTLVVLKDGCIRAQGHPKDILNRELVEAVYHVEADIVLHNDVPLVAPLHAVRR